MKLRRNPIRGRIVAGLLVFGVTLVCRADTIQLSSGQEVRATVTKYRERNFEVRTDDGKTVTYPSNNVRRIQFDTRSSPATLTTRTNGVQQGTISQFENGAFKMTEANGGERTFSGIFVERAEFVPNRGQSSEVITHGQEVDIKSHLALGNITIIDYYADWCGPCKMVSPTLEKLAQTDAEIALRKVDIVDWGSAVAKQYNITTLPRVEVYGRKGELIGTVRGADPDQVKRYVAQAKGS